MLFVLQSIVVGLAVAFLVVLVRPDLLPAVGRDHGAPASYADAVDLSAPAVASVRTTRLVEYTAPGDERTRFRVENAFGSAVVIDPDGYLVTNFHVIAEAAEIQVQLSDGRFANPEVVGVDAETDLALLKVEVGTLPVMALGSSSQLRIGDVVLAIGNPYGLSKSVTQGIVSGTGGLVDFVRGARMAKNGRSIVALMSTAARGSISRIVSKLDDKAVVSCPRSDIDYVVTEHGVARLKHKALDERAEALIAISHPDFREELEAAAKEGRR